MPFDSTDYVPAKVDPLTITDPRERLKHLADFLRELPDERFDMSNLFTDAKGRDAWLGGNRTAGANTKGCGTAACVAGWALALFSPRSKGGSERAGKLLGLSGKQGFRLFVPDGFMEPGFATPTQAARVIDHLLTTGEVDWSVTT